MLACRRRSPAHSEQPRKPARENVDRDGIAQRHPRGEARGDRRRRVQGRRDFRERPAVVQRHAGRRSRRAAPISAWRSSPSSRSAISRACRRQARAGVRARRAQVRPDGGTRLRSADGVLERVAGQRRRHRSRRRRLPRTRRARREARHAGRLRGAGLGPPHQRLSRRLGGGAARRPPVGRRSSSTASTSARARRRSAPSARSPAIASSWCRSPTRRCSTWTCCQWSRHFRNFPGQGDFPLVDFVEALQATGSTGRCRSRSSTTSSAPARRGGWRSTAIAR